jgi:hypothetical protein
LQAGGLGKNWTIVILSQRKKSVKTCTSMPEYSIFNAQINKSVIYFYDPARENRMKYPE